MPESNEQDRVELERLQAQLAAQGGRGVELAEEIDALRRKIAVHGRKFYRTVITIEVLTEGGYYPDSLEQVHYDIVEGDASGDWDITASEEISAEEVAERLEAQGSDASFLLGGEWEG